MTDYNLIFRKANKHDLKSISESGGLCAKAIMEEFPDGYCVVEDETKSIIGMYRVEKKQYEYEKDCYISCINHSLSNFIIHPDHRRKGIGTMMFQYLYDNLSSYNDCARLEFWIDNEHAYKFWTHTTHGLKNTYLSEVCRECPCECIQCEEGLDNYDSNILFDLEKASYFCRIIKYG